MRRVLATRGVRRERACAQAFLASLAQFVPTRGLGEGGGDRPPEARRTPVTVRCRRAQPLRSPVTRDHGRRLGWPRALPGRTLRAGPGVDRPWTELGPGAAYRSGESVAGVRWSLLEAWSGEVERAEALSTKRWPSPARSASSRISRRRRLPGLSSAALERVSLDGRRFSPCGRGRCGPRPTGAPADLDRPPADRSPPGGRRAPTWPAPPSSRPPRDGGSTAPGRRRPAGGPAVPAAPPDRFTRSSWRVLRDTELVTPSLVFEGRRAPSPWATSTGPEDPRRACRYRRAVDQGGAPGAVGVGGVGRREARDVEAPLAEALDIAERHGLIEVFVRGGPAVVRLVAGIGDAGSLPGGRLGPGPRGHRPDSRR